MMRQLLVPAAFTALCLLPAAARAESAAEILAKVDKAQNAFKDLTLDSTMTIHETSGKREVSFTSITKGPRRFVRFTAPGDIKGMGFLVESRDTLYAYLPGFNRVRRLGTHVKNQSFMGSDIAYEDMSQTEYASVYEPKLLDKEETPTAWVLLLTLKDRKEAEFPKLKVWVDKKIFQPAKVECYDEKGAKDEKVKPVKTQLREEFVKDEGSDEHYSPRLMTFIDHRRNDHKTELRSTRAKANSSVGDDVFSKRNLEHGN